MAWLAAAVAVGPAMGPLLGCQQASRPVEQPLTALDREALVKTAKSVFGALPAEAPNPENAFSDAKIDLGRKLFYDPRLSLSGELSCNSCHDLSAFGVDARTVDGRRTATSMGHEGKMGDRNSPSVYNAAFHIAQFWDGRAPDVEAQAIGPVTNPVEMAMPDPAYVTNMLKGIPGYVKAFKEAFPADEDPVTYVNVGRAIGAFERRLVTPGPFDDFANGDEDALTEAQLRGLDTFVKAGCIACHNGPAFGGTTYQKLGVVKPYETADVGRYAVTNQEADKRAFKVPSLRNIARTGPYLHDGSISSLDEMVELMAEYQLGRELADQQVKDIVAFLDEALTGRPNAEYIAKPELPAAP